MLRLKESLWIVALTLSLTIACSRGDGDNNQPSPDMSSTQDMSSTTPVEDMNAPKDMPADASMTPEDMGEGGDDMTPPVDMAPERCAEAAPCKQGYFYDGNCECKISFDRECETDADCREGETCKQFAREGSDKMDLVCYLDPASLTVVSCPGGPGCANSDGELLAAARGPELITHERLAAARLRARGAAARRARARRSGGRRRRRSGGRPTPR